MRKAYHRINIEPKYTRKVLRTPALDLNYRWLIFWFSLLFTGFFFKSVEIAVLILVAIRALKSPKHTVESYFILAFYLLGNSVFTSGIASNIRYLILFAGFFSVLFRKHPNNEPLPFILFVFFFVVVLISLFSSNFLIISILKALSFFIGTYTIIEGLNQTKHLEFHWFKIINSYFVFIILGSLLFFFTGLGYERNGTGFQGVMTHPQTFGPIMGVITAWFLSLTLVSVSSFKPLLLSTFSILFVFMSQSRTGLVAVILSGFITFLFIRQGKTNKKFRKKVSTIATLLAFSLVCSLLIFPKLTSDIIFPFIQKGSNTSLNINELFSQSRGDLTQSSMQNFKDSPLFGIGFGVPTNYNSEEGFGNIRYFQGIPIGASVEKGFLPSAILEEIGLIGFTLTVLILYFLIGKVRKKFTAQTLWILLAALFINIGEAVFFSLGGPGLFIWIIFGFTYNIDFFRPKKILRRKLNPGF